MSVKINLPGGGENLAETLDIGNFTTDGQKIRALHGTSSLNLRYAADNEVLLTNDDVTALLAYIFMNTTVLQMGFAQQFYIDCTALSSAFRVNGANAFISITKGAVQHLDVSLDSPTETHTIKLIENSSTFAESKSEDAALFLMSGSAANSSRINQNVLRSVCISGEGLTAKTDNTLYCNKMSIQDINSLFDNIIGLGSIPTQDNFHALQDKSGTLAHLSDTLEGQYVEKWTLYNATLNATWQTIVIADSVADSIIQITIELNTAGSKDCGIRAVGSILNRIITMTNRDAVTLTVKTNALKEIQVYASVAADISFNFSAQL
jgi:hypothetical protein